MKEVLVRATGRKRRKCELAEKKRRRRRRIERARKKSLGTLRTHRLNLRLSSLPLLLLLLVLPRVPLRQSLVDERPLGGDLERIRKGVDESDDGEGD